MNTPDPKYLFALARRVWDCPLPNVVLDTEVEVALFDPAVSEFISARPDTHGVRVIYCRADGTKEIKAAKHWTRPFVSTAVQLIERAHEIKAKTSHSPDDSAARVNLVENAIRIGIFNTCVQRGMSDDAAIAIVKGTMAQLCVASALAKGKAQ